MRHGRGQHRRASPGSPQPPRQRWQLSGGAGAAGTQAERGKHRDELRALEERHQQEITRMRADFEARADYSRQQQDDTGRMHDDLVAVRTELAEARMENESLYHKQLVPAQVCDQRQRSGPR